MKTRKNTCVSRLTAVILILMMLVPMIVVMPVSASISFSGQSMNGRWQSTKLKQGKSTYTVNGLVLDNPLQNCVSFVVSADVSMKSNTKCKNWTVWLREDGTYVKASTVFLSSGNGHVTETVYLNKPRSFDAVALTPASSGSYSWKMDMTLSDPVIESSYKAPDLYSLYMRDDAPMYKWERATMTNSGCRLKLYVQKFSKKISNCTSFDIAMDVYMTSGSDCSTWQIWLCKKGKFTKAATVYVPSGAGVVVKNVNFKQPVTFDSIVVTPTKMKSGSWNFDGTVYNICTR